MSEVACTPNPILVTSSLEETWPQDTPIIFLGQWCLRYSRKHVWEQLDHEVADYHWDDRQRIPGDLDYVRLVYERLLGELAERLNEIHSVSFSVRYWRIVAGWWLFYFIQIYFDRWQVIQNASLTYSGASLFRCPERSEIPASHDMAEFQQEMATDWWNEHLFADIAERWTTLNVRPAPDVAGRPNTHQDGGQGMTFRSIPARFARRTAQILSSLGRLQLMTGHRVSLRADYLKSSERRKLEVLLRQAPFSAKRVKLPRSQPEMAKRNWTLSGGNQDFERAVALAIPRYLPTCYLEGYADSAEVAARLAFPTIPRVVMTANAYSSDDLWKLWAAEQAEKGAKVVIAQHGGHYGTGKWSSTQEHETSICDRYLSWGWDDPREPKVTPAPATKLIGLKKRPPSRQGRCLQVTSAMPRYSYLMYSVPVGPQIQEYIDDQFRFTGALSPNVREELLVRLYPEDYGWDLDERWRDREPEIAVDAGVQPMAELLEQTRLYVATYNATTFLESISQGIPTVIFWNPKYWELADNAQPYFDSLKRAGVFFDDSIECAVHVNGIWDDVPAWWASDLVQEAVGSFADRFAYVGPRPLRELREALTSWS
jgi:putative transferase (TIGR04331 family)